MRETRIGKTMVRLLEGDITRMPADAIVNAANSGLTDGSGVNGAIHRAGGPSILEECRAIGGCPTGQAVVTGAGRLPARYVLHAVGPVWQGGRHGEEQLLASAYGACLVKATELDLRSIVFPAISTGVYGYPLDQAARVALRTVIGRLQISPGSLQSVSFALFGRAALATFEQALTALAPGR
jgi:O-acetyl-ADP-ribose deacetylase (regulator of RNase III)